MVLLSSMMRTAAFTGRTDTFYSRIAGRQGGAWADRTVRAAYPTSTPRTYGAPTRPPVDRDANMQALTDLHERGVVTDAEFAKLRAELHG
jgi:hypothetical protein